MTGRFGRDIPEFADSVANMNSQEAILRRYAMRIARALYFSGAVALSIAGYLMTAHDRPPCTTERAGAIGANDIGGVVSSSKGPEAGVWVIAETTDLPTRYIKEVVTDDQRALPDSRSAEGQLHRVGARLRPGGLAQGASANRARRSI